MLLTSAMLSNAVHQGNGVGMVLCSGCMQARGFTAILTTQPMLSGGSPAVVRAHSACRAGGNLERDSKLHMLDGAACYRAARDSFMHSRVLLSVQQCVSRGSPYVLS